MNKIIDSSRILFELNPVKSPVLNYNCNLIYNWEFEKGFSANSAGTNDIYLVRNRETGLQSIMKTHLDSMVVDSEEKEFLTHSKDRMEEYVYRITSEFVFNKISPNFVLYYDSGHDCDFDTLCKFVGKGECTKDIKGRLIRNLAYLLCSSGGRPSIDTGNNIIDNKLQMRCRQQFINRIGVLSNDGSKVYSQTGNRINTQSIYSTPFDIKGLRNILKLDTKFGYIALENIEGTTLQELFSKNTIGDNMIDVVTTLLYNVNLLSEYGISHNDLHLGNIMVTKKPRRDELRYQIYANVYENNESGEYEINIFVIDNDAGFLRIFDYDRSTIYGLVNKGTNKYFTYDKRRDLIILACSIFKNAKDDPVTIALLSAIFDPIPYPNIVRYMETSSSNNDCFTVGSDLPESNISFLISLMSLGVDEIMNVWSELMAEVSLEENMIAEFLAQTDNIDILKNNIFVSEDEDDARNAVYAEIGFDVPKDIDDE